MPERLLYSAGRMSSVEQLAGRMICVGFEGVAVPESLRELIERGVSAVILFARNVQAPVQVRELTREIKALATRPIMICIDQEGGRVQRLRGPGFSDTPSMRELGRSADPAAAQEVGTRLGQELRALGIDMNLAPVLDVDSNPANPVIGERSFGSNPKLVATLGVAFAQGLQTGGVAACGKHFPGHGDTHLDSHTHLPRLRLDLARLEQVELPPFNAAIHAKIPAIMAAHVVFEAIDPSAPATMSAPVIRGLLRERLGFDGVVISDDLEMKAIIDHFGIEEAVTRGAAAGIDLFSICHTPDLQHRAIDALSRAVENGDLSRESLWQSNRRFDALLARWVAA